MGRFRAEQRKALGKGDRHGHCVPHKSWRDGALMGTTPEEAFFVKCDRTTMTQDDIDNGRLICIIGVAPVKPAELVTFRIAQWAGGSSVTE